MSVAHTPGPWDWVERHYESNKFSIGADGKWLASIQHNGEQLVEKQRANMALIAAAPELLDALQRTWEALRGSACPNEIINARETARAAIAKATGDAA